jgi:hypothetical protein|tara:strand:- start:130 stop:294 length:165 start_codon:yes stop_codon:yes gene_type:complete
MQAAMASLPADVKSIWGTGEYFILSPTSRGAHVVMAEPKFSDSLATFGALDGIL